jgi:hypothetical protein
MGANRRPRRTNTNVKRKLIALLLSATAVAAAIAGVVVTRSGYQSADGGWGAARAVLAAPAVRQIQAPEPLNSDVNLWRERISTCLPETDTSEFYSSAGIRECLLEVFTQAAVKLDTQALATALSALIVERPLLGLPCHEPAHLIGEVTLRAAGGDITRALASHDHPSCEAGFIHGMIDAFAMNNPSPEEFARLVHACESSADTDMVHYCTHGVGHAAWIVTEDGAEASRYCALLRTPEGRAQCGEGVMMDMFEPATDRFPSLDRETAAQHLPGVCREWAEPQLPGMLDGCAHGSAFVFSKRALSVVYRWAETKLSYPYPETLPDAFLDELTVVGSEVASWCDGLGGRVGGACKQDLGIALPHVPHPLMLRTDVRDALCRPLGEQILQNCVSQVRNNI